MLSALAADAANYTTFLTVGRGFTEVKSPDDLLAGDRYCYILTAAERSDLYVGVGKYEAKPDWAGEDTKALRYRSASIDPVLSLDNFFTIARKGQYMGLRNVYYNSSFFQTHDNAGFMYVLTYTEPTFRDWCYLIPTWHNGYWLFENGKYPISSDNWACGYLGPWNKIVAEGEPIALNRRNTDGDAAGHYRLFRIDSQRLAQLHAQRWQQTPVDVTSLITNPSFETGDETGWTLIGKDTNGNDEFRTLNYPMSGKDGTYLMNAFQWWAPELAVSQSIGNVPAGKYRLTATMATWEGRSAFLTANDQSETILGQGDQTGVPISTDITIGYDGQLTIRAGATAQWWVEGHKGETQTFFKIDNMRLTCQTPFLDAIAVPLPNTMSTRLTPGQWYQMDIPFHATYLLTGNLKGLVYTTDGLQPATNPTTQSVAESLILPIGRVYFRTDTNNTHLVVTPERELLQEDFTAVALNVDGLPQKINYVVGSYDLNPDGPGADGTKLISQYLSAKDYDFIGCSEDFNYNGSLMESLNDRYWCGTIRNTLSVGDLDYWDLIQGKLHVETDGLNLIWKFNRIDATNESWTRWNDTESTDGNQYVEKGYRHYDISINGGPTIDVYILHMDAGDTNATWSRESQWRQLVEAINNADRSRAKLIIGDTNSRWTREDIISNFMSRLSADYTMSDVWVEFYRNGIYPTTAMDNLTDKSDPTNYTNYEIVDKIIYINPVAADSPSLTPESFRIEQDYTYGNVNSTDDTTPLGDHNPVVVTFSYKHLGNTLPRPTPFGDINNDGITNADDVTLLINMIIGLTPPSELADINDDGTISIADLTELLDIVYF